MNLGHFSKINNRILSFTLPNLGKKVSIKCVLVEPRKYAFYAI